MFNQVLFEWKGNVDWFNSPHSIFSDNEARTYKGDLLQISTLYMSFIHLIDRLSLS